METYSDIELQKIFAYADEVCARDLLQKQFHLLELNHIIMPDNLVGSTIEIPFKYLELFSCFIQYHHPNLGIIFREDQVIPTAELVIQIPTMDPRQPDTIDNSQMIEILEDSINIKDLLTELKSLRIDSQKNFDTTLSSTHNNSDQLNNTLKNMNGTLDKLSEQLTHMQVIKEVIDENKQKEEKRYDFKKYINLKNTVQLKSNKIEDDADNLYIKGPFSS